MGEFTKFIETGDVEEIILAEGRDNCPKITHGLRDETTLKLQLLGEWSHIDAEDEISGVEESSMENHRSAETFGSDPDSLRDGRVVERDQRISYIGQACRGVRSAFR